MTRRYVSVWFPYLVTDWLTRRQPARAKRPFAVTGTEKGRVFIAEANEPAEAQGVVRGMGLADARALCPQIEALPEETGRGEKLLAAMAEWCIRYTPMVGASSPDGIFLDITGAAHLMGGERALLKDVVTRFRALGYHARASMADTLGCAWAVARYGREKPLIESGQQKEALASLPVAALRLDDETALLLGQLGVRTIRHLYVLPRATLTRRFGKELCLRLDQALGATGEALKLVKEAPVYLERLPAMEGILTAEGILIALEKLLAKLCLRLAVDGKGARAAEFFCYRVDGQVERLRIGTGAPSRNPRHLYRLFRDRLEQIDPGHGIELFTLSAPHVEAMRAEQEDALQGGSDPAQLSELADRLTEKIGPGHVFRALPQASHAPERCVRVTGQLAEKPEADWAEKSRPVRLLTRPEPIEVMAPVPDYPPVLFRHKGKLHRIKRAEGPERIEPEWWIAKGPMRDYYRLEDESGQRYWIFRAGPYAPDNPPHWFLHGFFA
ncbi:MAG TPA: DNA polymerase Y family protein [Patescibacteria group bacterium]|nr:DNA polymerase Y family protein [Patescibacteria group bacterium]